MSYFTGDAAYVILAVTHEVIYTIRTRAKHARIRSAFVDFLCTFRTSKADVTIANVAVNSINAFAVYAWKGNALVDVSRAKNVGESVKAVA